MKSIAIAFSLSTLLASIAAPAFASHALESAVKARVDLPAGATLYIFLDGKMAKEDAYGRAVMLRPGEVIAARDGRQIAAVGNEVARLDYLLREGHGG
ncbi:CopK family periplasmic copper-binding protein [Ideonella sp.]|uniref:CopK family periplasmic copper-binding protein n=1 Tax=Ideonella sp. TaxID=1929293 RepID=UPI003BB4F764